MRRTPPKSTQLNVSNSIQSAHSDPGLHNQSTEAEFNDNFVNLSRRTRRPVDVDTYEPSDNLLKEISELFASFEQKQNMKFEQLNSTLEALQAQNCKIDESIAFFSLKYDELLERLDSSERSNSALKKQVFDLESKLEVLERQSRAASIEIRNIPRSEPENKDSLIANLSKIGSVINQPIERDDIRNIYRTKSQAASPSPSAVIVEFKSITLKENVLKSSRIYNKSHKEAKLSSVSIQLPGPSRPLYIAESLTNNARHLFYLARKLHKDARIVGCWTNHGRIFIQKTATSSALCVNTELELNKILSSNQ